MSCPKRRWTAGPVAERMLTSAGCSTGADKAFIVAQVRKMLNSGIYIPLIIMSQDCYLKFV